MLRYYFLLVLKDHRCFPIYMHSDGVLQAHRTVNEAQKWSEIHLRLTRRLKASLVFWKQSMNSASVGGLALRVRTPSEKKLGRKVI